MADWTNADPGSSFPKPGHGVPELSGTGPSDDGPSPYGLPGSEVLDGPQLDRQAIDQLARDALAAHLRVSPYLPPSLADSLVEAIAGDAETGASAHRERRTEQPEVPTGHPLEKLLSSFATAGNQVSTARPGELLPLGSSYHQLCLVSDHLLGELVEVHKIPPRLADEMVRHSQERAVCHLLMTRHNARELQTLTVSLHGKGAITPTLLLRSLCYGQLGFLEAALAVMGRMPTAQARLLIASGRPEELLRLYEQAKLPLGLFRAFRGAIDVIKSRRDSGARTQLNGPGISGPEINGPEIELCDLIIARWVKDYEDICPEGLDYVMTQFSRFIDPKRSSEKRILVRAS